MLLERRRNQSSSVRDFILSFFPAPRSPVTLYLLALLLLVLVHASQSLETAVLTRKVLVATIGRPVIDAGHITAEFLSRTCTGAQSHINRYVREASFGLITAIIEACGDEHERSAMIEQCVPVLATGLQVT